MGCICPTISVVLCPSKFCGSNIATQLAPTSRGVGTSNEVRDLDDFTHNLKVDETVGISVCTDEKRGVA